MYKIKCEVVDVKVFENNLIGIVTYDTDNGDCNPRDNDNCAVIAVTRNRYFSGDMEIKDEVAHLRTMALEALPTKSSRRFDGYINECENRDSDEWENHARKIVDKHYVVADVHAYVHSGIVLSTVPFGCRWDSGQAGVAYISIEAATYAQGLPATATWDTVLPAHSSVHATTLRQWANDRIEAEVKEYGAWLNGDVYAYELFDASAAIADGSVTLDDFDDATAASRVDYADLELLDSCCGFIGDVAYALEECEDAAQWWIKHKQAEVLA
jgi:hypothetical protein